jgi:hypothetical protein
VCPLCGVPDSLDHILLRCELLSTFRLGLKREVNFPYIRGSLGSSSPSPGCTMRAREYLRTFISLAFNEGEYEGIPDSSAVAMWLARPQMNTLWQLDHRFSGKNFSLLELRHLRRELLSISAKLLSGARSMWHLRCQENSHQEPSLSSRSCSRVTPGSIQPSIRSAFARVSSSRTGTARSESAQPESSTHSPLTSSVPSYSSSSLPPSAPPLPSTAYRNHALLFEPGDPHVPEWSEEQEFPDRSFSSQTSSAGSGDHPSSPTLPMSNSPQLPFYPGPPALLSLQERECSVRKNSPSSTIPPRDAQSGSIPWDPLRHSAHASSPGSSSTSPSRTPPPPSGPPVSSTPISSLADEEDPLLSNFISVADLRRAPGLTAIDFSLFCLPTNYSEGRSYSPLGGRSTSTPRSGSRLSPPCFLPSNLPPHGEKGRQSLPRVAKVQMGYAEDQALCLDKSLAGKLPPGFKPQKHSSLLHQHRSDYKPAWVQPSHFCPAGGQGLFFEVRPGRTLPAGTLIGIYSGRDNKTLKLSYKEARTRFQSSNYVMTYDPCQYVVDGQNGQRISGPAWCNDNFDMFNCLFSWNPNLKRIELHTKAPLGEGYYEALVNYSDPGKKSSFWTDEKILLLPPESRARCIAYSRESLSLGDGVAVSPPRPNSGSHVATPPIPNSLLPSPSPYLLFSHFIISIFPTYPPLFLSLSFSSICHGGILVILSTRTLPVKRYSYPP